MKSKVFFQLIITSMITLIFIYNCKKDNINPTVHYSKKISLRAYLDEENKITAYEYLDSLNNVINQTNIFYSDNSIIERSDDTIIKKYNLNTDGLIDCIIDSSIIGIDTVVKLFYYEDGYLKTMVNKYAEIEFDYTYSENHDYYYHVISVNLCDSTNVIDFIINPEDFYMNLINMGQQNKKLIKSINWGFNCGPSTNPSRSIYKYKLDKDGFVLEKIETLYPCYPAMAELPNPENYITTYEYIK